MTEPERLYALKTVASLVARCQRAQPKFAQGTPQHTLLKNRIQALQIAQALLAGGRAEPYSAPQLRAALEPLASVMRKCEKARAKYAPGSGQYSRFNGTIQAMALAQTFIENELLRRLA
ncbi:MAG: hypothetical protein ACK5L3_14555 [Oscillospiraceae bacterium]